MKGLLLTAATILAMTACGTPGAPQPPSLNIPQKVSDLKAVRKASTVNLTWSAPEETTDGGSVRKAGKMVVRRNLGDSSAPAQVGEVVLPPSPKADESRVANLNDNLTDLLTGSSADFAFYTVETYSSSGKTAGPSNPIAVPLVAVPATPQAVQLGLAPEGVTIAWQQAWTPEKKTTLAAQYVYRIMRRLADGNQQPVLVKDLPAGNSAALVIDAGIEWEKKYEYRVTPVTIWRKNDTLKGEVEGDDSPWFSILAHDSFPPAVPSGLQAVFSGVIQQPFIDLTWTPNTDSDLAGYNVYRRTGSSQPEKINRDLVKTPSFRDANVQPGMQYFYSVSAVDLRGNEGGRSPEASEIVPKQ